MSNYGNGRFIHTLDQTTTSVSAFYLSNTAIDSADVTLSNAFTGVVIDTRTLWASQALTFSGLDAATSYTLSGNAYDADGDLIGPIDELTLDTSLDTIESMALVKWRGERDGWVLRQIDADNQRVSISINKASRWLQYKVQCSKQNKRLVVKSSRLVLHGKAHGPEARTDQRE